MGRGSRRAGRGGLGEEGWEAGRGGLGEEGWEAGRGGLGEEGWEAGRGGPGEEGWKRRAGRPGEEGWERRAGRGGLARTSLCRPGGDNYSSLSSAVIGTGIGFGNETSTMYTCTISTSSKF